MVRRARRCGTMTLMRHRPSPLRAVSLLLTLSLLAASAAVPVPVAGAPSTVRLVVTLRPGTSHSLADRLAHVPGGKAGRAHRPAERPRGGGAGGRGGQRAEPVGAVWRRWSASRPTAWSSVDWIPPDPLWTKQWEQRQVRAQQAWDLERGERTTIVAVVDTGVQLNHPDLAVRAGAGP